MSLRLTILKMLLKNKWTQHRLLAARWDVCYYRVNNEIKDQTDRLNVHRQTDREGGVQIDIIGTQTDLTNRQVTVWPFRTFPNLCLTKKNALWKTDRKKCPADTEIKKGIDYQMNNRQHVKGNEIGSSQFNWQTFGHFWINWGCQTDRKPSIRRSFFVLLWFGRKKKSRQGYQWRNDCLW